jgi:TetR/AcrR family transcriptional regulator, cholesterol catabolism regulator
MSDNAQQLLEEEWQGENNFALFKSSVPISEQEIWQAFYDLHKSKIQVQKQAVAVEKLKTIVLATFKLVSEKGFALMSLRDLSQQTSMSMGSLYAYIGSKGQLAEMIHQFLPHIFDLCILEKLSENDSLELQMQKLIRGHIFITECLQPWFFFAYMETKHLSDTIKQLAKDNELRSETWFNQVIQSGQDEGVFVKTDPFLTVLSIKSLLQNWYVKRGKYRQAKVSCEAYIDFIEQMINQLIRVKP